MDSMGRPRDAAERERKRSKVVKVEAFASKLDETADWKSWVRQVGLYFKGLRTWAEMDSI